MATIQLKLNRYWEALKLDDGDYLLLNAQEDHFRIRTPPQCVVSYLEMIDSSGPFEPFTAIGKITREQKESSDVLWELQESLIKNGILIEASTDQPENNQLLERYYHLLDWFDGASPGTGWQRIEKLRTSNIAIFGCGGAGSFVAMMLAATGVGTITLIDGDHVEASNLCRQIFFTTNQAGLKTRKTSALSTAIRSLNPEVEVVEYDEILTSQSAIENAISEVDCVVLTADQPRMHLHRMANRACVEATVPLIYGFMGQVGPFFIPGESACFECLERHWRRANGRDHDQILAAFANKPARDYPSIVSGPALVAVELFDEVIALVTGISAPKSKNIILHLETGKGAESVPLDTNCPVCQDQNRTLPKNATHSTNS